MSKEDIWDTEIEVRESKGLLDPEVEHKWELYKRMYREGVIFSREAPEGVRGKVLSELDEDEREEVNPEWCTNGIEIYFRTISDEDNVELKMSELLWRDKEGNFTLSLNANKPEFQKLATLIVALRGEPLQDMEKVSLGKYIVEGTQFLAHTMPQRDKEGKETGYSELDIGTIRDVKVIKQKKQQNIGKADIKEEERTEINDIVAGIEKPAKDEVMRTLITNDKSHLMSPFIAMCDAGEFKWK